MRIGAKRQVLRLAAFVELIATGAWIEHGIPWYAAIICGAAGFLLMDGATSA